MKPKFHHSNKRQREQKLALSIKRLQIETTLSSVKFPIQRNAMRKQFTWYCCCFYNGEMVFFSRATNSQLADRLFVDFCFFFFVFMHLVRCLCIFFNTIALHFEIQILNCFFDASNAMVIFFRLSHRFTTHSPYFSWIESISRVFSEGIFKSDFVFRI